MNRAIDGDVVAVEIIAGLSDDSGQLSQSCPPAEASSSSSSSSSSTSSAQIAAETCEATPEAVEGLAPSAVTVPQRGRVVGIVRRGTRTYAGSISSELILTSNDDADAAGGGNSHHHHHDAAAEGNDDESSGCGVSGGQEASAVLFLPVNRRVPPIEIITHRAEELRGKRVLVSVDGWPADSAYPLGHYVRTMGVDGDKETETAVLLHEFDVPHESLFSTSLLSSPSSCSSAS